MAQIKRPIQNDGPINGGEQRLQNYLQVRLPDDYIVIPNVNLAITGPNHVMKYWEYDVIVIAPHAIFHIENKDWGGNLTGDDYAWFVNGQERKNPHETAGLKSRILASKLKNIHPDWNFGQVLTLVTLSNPQQSKFGMDPHCECYNQTFTLNDDLIRFLTNPELINRRFHQIQELQKPITDMLCGQSVERLRKHREYIFDLKIEEVLQETEQFTEFLCVPKLIGSSRYKVREYALDLSGKSPKEHEEFKKKVQNAKFAQDLIGSSPYIVATNCRMNDEETYYYEISRYQDESSLRAKLRMKTFKQIDKVNIVLDVAKALQVSHENNVFHRDVRPENIYVLGDKAQLANFGMSWFAEHLDNSFTVGSDLNLKSPYSAPEMLDGDVNSGSDIFSLGVIFYELMVGKVPFDSSTVFALALGGKLPDDLLPSNIVKDLPHWIDEVVRNTIVAAPENRWQTAEEFINFVTKALEEEHKKTLFEQKKTETKTTATQVLYLKDLKPGMNVSPSLTLHEQLGKGGFGRVFKAWHDMQKEYFAIKIFERDSSIENALNEFQALKELDHPNIVKFKYNDRTQPGNLFYTLMELLDGENLQDYTKGDLRLPISEVYKMAKQILDALVYMQDKVPPVFHRDIKPNNIMWNKRTTFKLIDFNIATTTDDKSLAGTFPYMAPDLVKSGNRIDWDCSADTFALGVTIYQLLTHAYPWPGSSMRPNIHVQPTDIRKFNDKLSDAMADFVMKSIITDNTQRFKTAKEMYDALVAIGDDGILKDTSVLTTFTKYDGNEKITPVEYLNSLYSQSRHGNGGTRAGSRTRSYDILTYTQTKLDKQLLSDIQALKYKLIIITGNAGDGKTAFIHQIENKGTDKISYDSYNGSEFTINGVRFQSNYDGSQDENDVTNDQVLTEFFSPFYALSDYTSATEGRVIAINEGRLVDFLTTQPELKKLQDNIEEFFYQEGHAELLPGLMVINLNLRSVTARGEDGSLLAQQVKKLTRPELWAGCEGCPIADRCFIKYNVDTFQDSSAGDEVINRLEWLVRTIVYKRELHITMRDLRSMIAWMLTRDFNCDEVKQLIEFVNSEDIPEYYWQFYYFNVTAPAVYPKGAYMLPSLDSEDRLVKLLRETDVAGVALPAYDRDLYYMTKRPENYLMFSERKQSVLPSFNRVHTIVPSYEIKEGIRDVFTGRHKAFIRHQYFEGIQNFKKRLPYRHASDFYKKLNDPEESLKETMQNLASAISSSEGCDNKSLKEGYLLLASSNVGDPISKSYRRFALDEFELFVNRTDHLTNYIEYESDSLTFRHKEDKFIQLTVSLDLFEMLEFIKEGFSPSVNDLRGRFIELQIFKNLLEAKTYKEILVTKNNRKFTVVRLDEDKHIVIEPLNA